MMSHRFFKMAAAAWQFYFQFRLYNFAQLGKSKSTYVANPSPRLRYYYFRFLKKQTFAMLEFYFRFRFSPLRHHRHVILHPATKSRQNWTIPTGVMAIITIFKMAVVSGIEFSQFYFRFRISSSHRHRHNTEDGGQGRQFYFRFRFS